MTLARAPGHDEPPVPRLPHRVARMPPQDLSMHSDSQSAHPLRRSVKNYFGAARSRITCQKNPF